MTPLAIVAGEGALPRLLAEDCARRGRDYRVVLFADYAPEWALDQPVIRATFEKPGALFDALGHAGCTQVSFAGGMQRPRLNPLKFDWKFLQLAPKLLPALKSGDDVTLRVINSIFEAEELEIVPPHSLLGDLLVPSGCLTELSPSDTDQVDIARAMAIARALGAQDVGQGAVVAQGICLGVESIQGTDALLRFVAQTAHGFRFDTDGAKGVLVKCPKPDQDWRVDLPAIGPQTVENAALAGLGGIAVQAGGVLMLGRKETLETADRLGLFVLGVAP